MSETQDDVLTFILSGRFMPGRAVRMRILTTEVRDMLVDHASLETTRETSAVKGNQILARKCLSRSICAVTAEGGLTEKTLAGVTWIPLTEADLAGGPGGKAEHSYGRLFANPREDDMLCKLFSRMHDATLRETEDILAKAVVEGDTLTLLLAGPFMPGRAVRMRILESDERDAVLEQASVDAGRDVSPARWQQLVSRSCVERSLRAVTVEGGLTEKTLAGATWVPLTEADLAGPKGREELAYETLFANPREDDLLGKLFARMHDATPREVDDILGKAMRPTTTT